MKLICKQVINGLLGGTTDFVKVQRLIPRDKGFSPADIRAALAAVNYILREASVNSVTDDVLNRELQQLGLPKENSDGISRPFRNNRTLLADFHSASSLAVSSRVLRSRERQDDSASAAPSAAVYRLESGRRACLIGDARYCRSLARSVDAGGSLSQPLGAAATPPHQGRRAEQP
jgi:hypothetical protein